MRIKLILVLMIFCTVIQSVNSQNQVRLNCGDIVEATFENDFELHEFVVEMTRGNILTVTGEPYGDNLDFSMALLGPTNLVLDLDIVNGRTPGVIPSVASGLIGANGDYTVRISNAGLYNNGTMGPNRWGVGLYTVTVNCADDGPPEVATQPVPELPVPSFGFPGLVPVDFSQGVTIPLQVGGAANQGSISDSFVGIFGYTFSANAGDSLLLRYTKQSGNLNLGLAIIAADNTVAFQASLMGTTTSTNEILLPVTGDYTIGVYRSSLAQPANPEATTFEIVGIITGN